MSILGDILNKRKLKYEELSQEEQQTFKEWQLVLNKEELNIEDIKNEDIVLSHDGSYQKVLKTFKRSYTGNIITIGQ